MLTRELLKRYLENRCTREELTWLQDYFAREDPDRLQQLLDEDWVSTDARAFDPELEEIRQRIWVRLAGEVRENERNLPLRQPVKIFRQTALWAGMAAAIALIILFGQRIVEEQQSPFGSEISQHQTEHRNNTGQPLPITLPDGSRVVLEPNSSLRHAPKFEANRREVHLYGKAFFDVRKDSLSPFFVLTNSVIVRVLGTSFNVISFENRPAEVSVLTGQVAVSVGKKGEETILKPNERVVQTPNHERLTKVLVEEPVVTKPELMKDLFHFEEVPLPEVFRVFEEAYDIRIHFDMEALRHCTINAHLEDQSLFTKLKMICLSMGLTYEVAGTEIVISGEGCQ